MASKRREGEEDGRKEMFGHRSKNGVRGRRFKEDSRWCEQNREAKEEEETTVISEKNEKMDEGKYWHSRKKRRCMFT